MDLFRNDQLSWDSSNFTLHVFFLATFSIFSSLTILIEYLFSNFTFISLSVYIYVFYPTLHYPFIIIEVLEARSA